MTNPKEPQKVFNSSITTEEFLKEYWNKKPLLIKNAFPAAPDLAQPDELAGLALDEDFETRVVYKDDKGKRKMLHGPFEEDKLQELGQKAFALICHNLNTLAPEFYELEKAVDFIPKWEFDDVMSVYSNKDMSLGAHIDNYNVFILQGQGKRSWEIQEKPDVAWRSDEEIKVLQKFTPDYTWELGPGDMVYIPPGVAHHGISVEESISYSIGFKSLETVDAFGEFMADLKQSDMSSSFYKNPTFNSVSQSDVTDDVFDFLGGEITKMLSPDGEFRDWLYKKLSSSKFPIQPTGDKAPKTYKGLELQRDVYLKYSFYKKGDKSIVCVNQTKWELSEKQSELLLQIIDCSPFESFQIGKDQEAQIKEVIDTLFEQGCLFVADED